MVDNVYMVLQFPWVTTFWESAPELVSWASIMLQSHNMTNFLSFTCMIHAETGSPEYHYILTHTTSFLLSWSLAYSTSSCQQILGYRVQCRNQGGHTVPSTPATIHASYSHNYTVSNLYPYTYYRGGGSKNRLVRPFHGWGAGYRT